MSIIQSRHNSNGKEAITNREHNDSLSKDLRKKILENSRGGRPEMVKRHQLILQYGPLPGVCLFLDAS
jgi:hypothetical protein